MIELYIGEPWDEMQENSTAFIKNPADMLVGYESPEYPSQLFFDDKKFHFHTPKAKFFVVLFNEKKKVHSIRISPQMDLLPIDDILKIIVDIENQLKENGWFLVLPKENPAFENNQYWRNKILHARNGASTYWQAADKYQVAISVGGYDDNNWKNEKRYLISMSIGKPWIMSDEEFDQIERKNEEKAKREGKPYVRLVR
ncbi:hypothetical protein [Limnobacter sp.]|uniref:hypothetical protein n=1 Tax=Limnobacter sp. TaxID=2003368 RepID=UPI00258A3D76|nr:hypothetical protein [Limnobacter sp.]